MLYLHNPADKHDTHVAVFLRCLEALRALPPEQQPSRVLGCEVWRDLDWMVDSDKVPFDAGRDPELAQALLTMLPRKSPAENATTWRRSGACTFHTSHVTDRLEGITWAMELTPLLRNPDLSVVEFVLQHIDRLRADVADRLGRFGGS